MHQRLYAFFSERFLPLARRLPCALAPDFEAKRALVAPRSSSCVVAHGGTGAEARQERCL